VIGGRVLSIAIPDLSLFLGFLQPQYFDVPLISTGEEDLYFTMNPSPDLTARQLREILYDHLVTRRVPEINYDALSEEAQAALAEYNELHSGVTVGIGRIDPLTETWTPFLPAALRNREPAP
jgi:adenosine tuberculosinyltransferase